MTPSPLRLVVPGAAGKMGRMLVRIIAESEHLQLAAATEHAGSLALGQDAGLLAGAGAVGVRVTSSDAPVDADVIIDFTSPQATVAMLSRAAEARLAVVIGTPGLGEAERKAIEQASSEIPIVFSANMSLGVNVLFGLLRQAARTLGNDYDIEIVESHHRHKRDAPSGTALAMAQVLTDELGRCGASAW